MTGLGIDKAALDKCLATREFGRAIRCYEDVSSTNDLAREWCARGAPDGAVVFAEHQSAGRGRFSRTWRSQSGLNLTFSLVIRNNLAIERINLAVIGTAVAIGSAISRLHDLDTQIKWPNDVLVADRKCCGILFETETTGHTTTCIVAGIGINVNQTEFDGTYRTPPTSIAAELGMAVPREQLLAEVLKAIEDEMAAVRDERNDDLHLRYQQHMLGVGTPVEFRAHDKSEAVRGITAGIDRDGALQIMTGDGLRRYMAGEIV